MKKEFFNDLQVVSTELSKKCEDIAQKYDVSFLDVLELLIIIIQRALADTRRFEKELKSMLK